MFPIWRLKLREARVALQNGRYDDACRVLADESLREFLPAKQIAQGLAEKIVERARNHFASGDTSAGWKDLQTADRLGGQVEAVNKTRHDYAEKILHDARKYLAAGEPSNARSRLAKIHKHCLADERTRNSLQIAQLMQESSSQASHGHFSDALTTIRHAQTLARLEASQTGIMNDVATHLGSEAACLESRVAECQRLANEMHTALATENWSAVLSAADALLAIAPQHSTAVQARRRAWKAVGMDVTHVYTSRPPRGPVSLAVTLAPVRHARHSTRPTSRSSEVDTVAGTEKPNRALLWIDAVGGFLVCLDEAITIGQPSAGESIALPILADLSRRHAMIRRDAGAYILEPLHRTLVDLQEIQSAVVLADNQLIQLGDNVRLRFNKPHALSSTAKLTLESHHKTQPSADTILLMADSCVLGPSQHCHVRCRDWQRDVVIYRQNDQVFCRADETLSVDGVQTSDRSELQSGARVEGEDFSFAWETL